MASRDRESRSTNFLHHYESAAKAAKERLRAYLGDPGESNTHALRSALRRLDATLRIMPKKARRAEPSLDEYEKRCRKVLRLTSPIRDVDMISARLSAESSDRSVARLLRELRRERREAVDGSAKAAWKLFETKVPGLDSKAVRGVSTRTKEIIERLEGKVEKDLRKVLASESRIDELHTLRKRCKRLRYLLELTPESEKRAARVSLLRRWQDHLGTIRDHDVLIARLGQAEPSTATRGILNEEKLKRHESYLRFARGFGKAADQGKTRSATG